MMKHFSKIISILLTIIILGAALAGCSGKGNETSTQTPVQTDTQNESTSPSEASGSVQNESGAVEDHKVLVVYFSYTGHLDSMAHWIADETGGDIVGVTAKEAYPDDYDETVDRAKEERRRSLRILRKNSLRNMTRFSSASRYGGMICRCRCGPSWKAMILPARRSSPSFLMRAHPMEEALFRT